MKFAKGSTIERKKRKGLCAVREINEKLTGSSDKARFSQADGFEEDSE